MIRMKYPYVAISYLLIIGFFLSVAYWTSRVTTTVANMIPLERETRIIIDAGHGGVDGGAISCTGIPESRYNLEISLKLNDLMHLLGYETVMIRREDISVYTSGETIAAKKVSDLRNRVRIVNEITDGILISIHQNTFPDSQYSGPQVFYGKTGEGEELAKILQLSLNDSLKPDGNRQSKKAEGIYLMDHIRSTGVLIECGFLSNPAEEMKLRSDSYQQKLCCVIGTTVGNFLDG